MTDSRYTDANAAARSAGLLGRAMHHINRATDPDLLTASGAQAEAQAALALAVMDLADAIRSTRQPDTDGDPT